MQTDSVKADFTQQGVDPGGEKITSGHGVMRLLRPNLFRWDYQGEEALTLASDGRNFWTYDPLLRQATVIPLEEALGHSPLAMLIRGQGWEEVFAVERNWQEGVIDWVELRPRFQEGQSGKIMLGFENRQLARLEFSDVLGQRVRVKFAQMEANVPMLPTDFRYAPPEGTDILGHDVP